MTISSCLQTVSSCPQTVSSSPQTVSSCLQTVSSCLQTVSLCLQTASHYYNSEASHTPSDRSNEWRADNRRLVRPKTILNIDESKLVYKLSVFLSWQYLRYTVSRHLVCRDLFYVELLLLDLFTDLYLIDIDVLKLRVELIYLLYNDSDCLLVIVL